MDPLSVLGVTGSAVATGRTIATILQDCCDARDDLTTARNQVTDLQSVLEQLNPTENGASRPKKLTKAVKRCGKILSKIDQLLEEYRNTRLRWAFFGKARLAELQRDLQASKLTLVIYINITKDKDDRVYDRLGDIEMKLDALANSNNSGGPPLALPPPQGTPSIEPAPLPPLLQGVPSLGLAPLPQASRVPGHLPPLSQGIPSASQPQGIPSASQPQGIPSRGPVPLQQGIPSRGPAPLLQASRVPGPQFPLSQGISPASQPQGIPSRGPVPLPQASKVLGHVPPLSQGISPASQPQGIPSRGPVPLPQASKVLGHVPPLSQGFPSASQPQGIPSRGPIPLQQGIPSRGPAPLPQASRGPISLQQGLPPRGPISLQQGPPPRAPIPLQQAPVPSQQGIPSRGAIPLQQGTPLRGPIPSQQVLPPRGPIPPQQGIPQRGPLPPPLVPQTNTNLQHGAHQNPCSSTITSLWSQPAQPSHDRTAIHTAQWSALPIPNSPPLSQNAPQHGPDTWPRAGVQQQRQATGPAGIPFQ